MRGFNQIERQLRNKIDSLIKQKETELTVNSKIVGYLNRKKDELNDLNDDWEKKKLEETKQLVRFQLNLSSVLGRSFERNICIEGRD